MRLFRKKNIKTYTDNDLIAEYRSSADKYWVGELYKRYSHLVYGVCLKYFKNEDDSKDAVLQIFENLMEDLMKHNITNFKSWLHSVSRNHCLMALRKEQTKLKRLSEYEVLHEDREPWNSPFGIHDKEEKEHLLTKLEQAMAVLKDEQRVCIELFFIKEKCYKEVAEITGYDIKKVKSFIQNGKRNLANMMMR